MDEFNDDFCYIDQLEKTLNAIRVFGIIIGVIAVITLILAGLLIPGVLVGIVQFYIIEIIQSFGMTFIGHARDVRTIRILSENENKKTWKGTNDVQYHSVDEILAGTGFEWFVSVLKKEGITQSSSAKYLTEQDLIDLGIEKMYQRKALLHLFSSEQMD